MTNNVHDDDDRSNGPRVEPREDDIENLQKAFDDASFLVRDLTDANKGTPPLVSLALLPMIEQAVALRANIGRLIVATKGD